MKRILIATTALFALGTSAYAADSITTTGLTASADTVTIPDVKAGQKGYVAIHAVVDGKVQAPQSIGHAMVEEGDNASVVVTIDEPLQGGMSYVAMLHAETNDNATYDFGPGSTDVDTPVMADGKAVTQKFTLKAMDASAMAPDAMDKGAMDKSAMDKGAMEKGSMATGAMAPGAMEKTAEPAK